MSVSSASNRTGQRTRSSSSEVENAISVITNPSKKPSEVQAALKSLKDLSPEDQNLVQNAIQQAAQHQSFISNILRTLHETAMSIIRNMRA